MADKSQSPQELRVELLFEVGMHLGYPLGHKSLRSNHGDASHQPTELELVRDQSGLDRLAQPDFIDQEIAHAVARNRLLQSTDLVG
jgi:hypothetical protein